MKLLVTGGAGYIGSHACVEFLEAGHDVVVVDNFSNSSPASLRQVERIAGRALTVAAGDIRDRQFMSELFHWGEFDAVVHFAGLKAVGESVEEPLRYYDNNVGGSVALFECMLENGVKTLVFSSSATVYGDPETVPIREDFPLRVTNPYGRTKLMIEDILRDMCATDPSWRVALLRYFNPVGAHASGLIGESPNGVPNNLMPYVGQVAVGRRDELSVFGGDYPTPDGTGVRDYIHVVDLARGHLAALDALAAGDGLMTVNLGTGCGYSVLEVLRAFEKACGKPVPYRVVDRRPGDVATCYADPERAAQLLGWRAEFDLDTMCRDAWRWQVANPLGFENIEQSIGE